MKSSEVAKHYSQIQASFSSGKKLGRENEGLKASKILSRGPELTFPSSRFRMNLSFLQEQGEKHLQKLSDAGIKFSFRHQKSLFRLNIPTFFRSKVTYPFQKWLEIRAIVPASDKGRCSTLPSLVLKMGFGTISGLIRVQIKNGRSPERF